MTIGDLIRQAISISDGLASDVLMRAAGGGEKITEYVRSLDVQDVTIATTEAEMGRGAEVQYRNSSKPEAMAKLFRVFYEGRGLSRSSRAFLLDALTKTSTGPRRIKGLLPPDGVVAHKTGTSSSASGKTAATNDAGIVTLPNGNHLVLVVFVAESPANEGARESVIARIARAAWDFWTAK